MSNPSGNPAGEWIASELVKENPDLVDLVEDFVGSLADRIGGLQAALDAQDLDQVRSLSHQLKGTGGGHGYPILTEKAAVIEQQAVAGEVEKLKAGIEELCQIVARVVVTPPAS